MIESGKLKPGHRKPGNSFETSDACHLPYDSRRYYNTNEPSCEIPAEMNKLRVVLIGGLNPIAVAEEISIEA